MNYELFGDLLLLRILATGNKTRGGLIIPEMAIDNTPWQRAEVAAASEGWHNANGIFISMPVNVGDVIIFFRQSKGQIVFPVDSEEMLLIRFADVGMRIQNLDKVSSLVSPHDGQRITIQ